MKTKTLFQKKLLAGLMAAIMLVTMAVPTMAFAAENETAVQNEAVAEAGSVTINPLPGAVNGAVLKGYEATITADFTSDVSPVHIDWSSSDKNIVSVGQHKGNLVAKGAGTVTITATLKTGDTPAGTGGGAACPGEALASATMQLTVNPNPDYTFQGDTNQLKMVSPSDITVIQEPTAGTDGKFVNKINQKVTAEDGYILFDFTMNAGMNNFNEDNFIERNMPRIKVYDTDYNVVAQSEDDTIMFWDFANKTITIAVDDSQIDVGQDYILSFDKELCGNNPDKILGNDIEFVFSK